MVVVAGGNVEHGVKGNTKSNARQRSQRCDCISEMVRCHWSESLT